MELIKSMIYKVEELIVQLDISKCVYYRERERAWKLMAYGTGNNLPVEREQEENGAKVRAALAIVMRKWR